jgi:hypothetical protein
MNKSASPNRRSENVRVTTIIIAELKFRNIKRHVFAAHFVECSDHSTLNDRPETLDGLSMNHANDVLAMDMVNGGVWIFFVEMFVADPLISAEQANFMRHSFTDKTQSMWSL